VSEPRPKCLVVLTALRFSAEYGEAALRAARERSEDVVLGLVVDRDLSESVAGQLADVGFLGERLMHDLRDTMIAEYRDRGLAHLEILEREARGLGLDVATRVVEGAFRTSVLELARETAAQRIVVARMNVPHVSRLFFGSEIDALIRESPVPVEVYHLRGTVLEASPGTGRAGS
jgi:nucleotide-binding universal stress UspA family protein